MKFLYFMLLIFLAALSVEAQPKPQYLIPCGGIRGQELELTVTGNSLETITDILFYQKGIELLQIIEAKPKALKIKIKIDDNCALGQQHLRLYGKDNFSEVLVFTVGQYPVHIEKEDNGSIDTAEHIKPNTTIDGIIKNEDIDYFSIDLKKGETINAEVEINRLSHRRNGTRVAEYFDTHLSVLDKNSYMLKDNDDTVLTKLDPFLQFIAPRNGRYYIAIRSSEFTGFNDARYRLHIGHFPRPLAVYPAGGLPNSKQTVTMILNNGSTFKQDIQASQLGLTSIQATRNQHSSPTPLPFHTSPLPSYLEKKDNDSKASVKEFPNIPVTFDGIIEKDNDADWWAFTAKKGINLRIEVLAHKLGTGLDSILEIYNTKGQLRKRQDDSGSPDAAINYKTEYDGKVYLRIKDQLNGGKPHFVYRIQVIPKPKSLSLSLPSASDNNQLGQEIRVHKGGKSIYQFLVNRNGSSGKDTLSIEGLPEGISYTVLKAPEGKAKIPILFEAKNNAPFNFSLSSLNIKSENNIQGELKQEIIMVKGRNNRSYAKFTTNKLSVGVVENAPFKISIEKQSVPLPHLGYVSAKVKIERLGDFKGEVKVRLSYKVDGLSAIDQMTLKAGQTTANYIINANSSAPVGDWPIIFTASASYKGISFLLAADEYTVKIIPSFLNVKMAMQSFRQNDNDSLDVDLESLNSFDGQAKVLLQGLPNGISANELKFDKSSKKISFDLKVTDKARRGEHKSAFLALTIPYGKLSVHQNIRLNGVIRIDPPAKKVASTPTKKTSTKPKKLSRLEELRQKKRGEK
jgi:hypothetical protein